MPKAIKFDGSMAPATADYEAGCASSVGLVKSSLHLLFRSFACGNAVRVRVGYFLKSAPNFGIDRRQRPRQSGPLRSRRSFAHDQHTENRSEIQNNDSSHAEAETGAQGAAEAAPAARGGAAQRSGQWVR